MLPWSFSEEAAAQKYIAQLQHNMWVTNATTAALSIITGGGKWVELTIPADLLYQHLLLTAEKKFWRSVESGEPPRLFLAEPPRVRIEAVRIVDMSSSNSWAEFAGIFCRTRSAFLEHENAKAELKGLMPEDAKEAIGHGVRAKRSKSGAISFDLVGAEVDMQRSSELIGAIASALAKAQSELINPEKSLIANIRSPFPRESERTFAMHRFRPGWILSARRWASTRSRPCRQPRSTKMPASFSSTTVLAHSSGEWVSSDWSVCPVGETAAPHKMGAALTYARRYALFTLVGIAGEDDLDAPDLPVSTTDTGSPGTKPPEKMNGRAGDAAGKTEWHRKSQPPKPVLDSEASAMVRDKLGEEIAALNGVEAAIEWAGRSLGAKNTLTTEDAAIVEAAFRERMQVLQPEVYSMTSATAEAPNPPVDRATRSGEVCQFHRARSTKSATENSIGFTNAHRRPPASLSKTAPLPRQRSFTLNCPQPCTVCGRQPCEAHHLRFAQPRALGRRVSDEFTVPLCRVHHRELHRQGDEGAWWKKANIDPMSIALRFWQQTRGMLPTADAEPKTHEQMTDVSIEQESEAGPPSNADLHSWPAITDDGSTTR